MARKILAYTVSLVVLPALIILALEGVSRVFATHDMSLRVMYADFFDERSGAHPYVNRAGYDGQVWQRRVRINSMHLRSPEPDPNEAEQKIRVLLIGDSVIFGEGLSDEEAPTALLESMLGDRYLVMNAGVPGYSGEHTLAFLEEFGDTLQPDVIIYGYCLNDAVPGSQQTRAIVTESIEAFSPLHTMNFWLIKHSMLYLQLKDMLNIYRLRHGYLKTYRPLYDDATWARTNKTLTRILAWCRERSVPFALVVFPHRDQLIEAVPSDDYPQRLLAELGEDEGFTVLDLAPELTADHFLSNDPLHLDRDGMRVAMGSLVRLFESERELVPVAAVD